MQNAPKPAVRVACGAKCMTVLHNETNLARAPRFGTFCRMPSAQPVASSGVDVSPRAASRIRARSH